MTDMLVKLFTLPDVVGPIAQQRAAGVDIRRALAPEKHLVVEWVRAQWNAAWANECEVAFSNHPISCFVAVENERLIGFACHDVTSRNFFGPLGVLKSHRGRDIGAALLLACLHAMAAHGYAYAIIGAIGPADFYSKTVGATIIEDSTPSVLRGMLQTSD